MDNRRYTVTLVLENHETRQCVIDAVEAVRLTSPQAFIGSVIPPPPEFLWFRGADGGGFAVRAALVRTVSIDPAEPAVSVRPVEATDYVDPMAGDPRGQPLESRW